MWHNNWGTVKATNARACALYHEIANVGKMVESSKKRVIWRLKVEEGREFEISLTHSLASGKKVLRVDGIVKYTAQAMSFGDWDYVFNLAGGHVCHCIIKPSVELNDMYDLIIDGVSFRRLPDHIEPRNSNLQASHTSNYRPGRSSSSSFNFSNGTYDSNSGPNSGANSGANSRENSFNPWECPRCTLVNSKPLAPVCEACGTSKPEHPKIVRKTPNTNATQMQNVNKPLPAQIEDLLGDNVHEQVDNSNGFGIFNPFGTEISNSTNSGFANFGSDPFGQSSFSAPPPVVYSSPPPQQQPQLQATYGRQVSHEEISNMLSGLDFSSPISSERVPQVVPQPKESETDSNSRTSSGDLWQSNMVDLNLKPQDRKKSTSIKSMQTLEQARVKAPLKEKTPVMPPPVPQNTFGTNMATLPSANGMMMYPQVSNQHIVTQGGFGASQFGTAQVPPSYISGQPQQFMTNIPPMGMHMGMGNAPGQKKSFVGVDPFATLS